MGQRMPDEPIEYGDNCTLGWPAGKTPKFVYVRFSKVVKCPDNPPTFFSTPPNDRVFKLTQLDYDACSWRYSSPTWCVDYALTAGPLRTHLFLTNADDVSAYFLDQPTPIKIEGYVFHNQYTTCPGFLGAHDGIAVVTWTPQATDILEAINLAKARDLFMELFPRDDGKLVYKFCRLEDATNIKILFEP